jgi:hypothetical protein
VKRLAIRNALPFAALAAIAVIALALQLTGINGSFLSDDMAHMNLIFSVAERSALPSWTLARFYEPLGSGNYAYRALAFASFVVDWLAYGENATGWRVTNVLLYSLNASAAGMVVWRWLDTRAPHPALAGALAGCMLFAYPFTGEISYWLPGRADLLVCLFTLLYLLALPLDRRSTAVQQLSRFVWLLCALASKESAIPLPLIATLLVFASAAAHVSRGDSWFVRGVRTTVVEMWPSWIALLAYLLLRVRLFGSPWQVYPSVRSAQGFVELWERFSGIGTIAKANVGAHYVPWTLAAAVLILAIFVTCLRSRKSIPAQSVALMLILLVGLLLYLLAPAFSIPVSSPDGEGARHFYIAWAYAALLLGVLAGWGRATANFGIVLVALMVAGQPNGLWQWQAAGKQMKEVLAGVGRIAPTIRDDQYALLLLPDHIGVALFARNAQGSIVMPPVQRHDYLPRMAVMVSSDFAAWSNFITDGKIAELKNVPEFNPANFVGLYCWNATKAAFVPLTDGRVALDPQLWLTTAKSNFPQTGCMSPF